MKKKIKEFLWGGENRRARVLWEIMIKHPKEGGIGARDPIGSLDAKRVMILKKIITKNRQPWMRYCERKLTRIANRWETREAMAAKPTKKQLKKLKNECLTESALKIWLEVGGTKKEENYKTIKKGEEIKQVWESGFGVEHKTKWTPIENITSKIVYDLLIQKRNKIKNYTPNQAHTTIYNIKQFLTPEERNYWWHFNHNIISVKQTESKYKRDENGNLSQPTCPLCKKEIETREHYNNKCEKLIKFRKAVARTVHKQDFTEKEWNLQSDTKNTLTTIIIAKSRWVLHCERCSLDHKRRKRLNLKVVLNRTLKRMEPATRILESVKNNKKKKKDKNNNTETQIEIS